jgi:rRNA maturation RNase YbeY
MHKVYLNNPEPTDVITFDLGEESVEGEIYISVDRAKEQSCLYNVALDEEIIRLMIHGLLHLKGFNDIEDEDRKEMKKEEYRLIELVKKQIIT